MSSEMIQQRIKYLVEHGEVWPQERRRLDRRLVIVAAVVIAMNVVECILLVMRH